MKKLLDNKVILITGGSGYLGRNLTKHILENYNPQKIIIYSRNEANQYEMQCKFDDSDDKLRYFIGDIRDYPRLNIALNEVEIVIHTAALKRIEVGEYNPFEMVSTNIIGTENLIKACINNYVEKVLVVSSDKAVSPATLYGATKQVAEKLVQHAKVYKSHHGIDIVGVRYGNVLGSTGSVIPHYLKLIKSGVEKLPVTDVRMTRFNLTIEDAIKIIMLALKNAESGQILVPKIKSYKLLDVVKAFDMDYKVIGIRDYEKIHEVLIDLYDYYTEEFDYYVVHSRSEYSGDKVYMENGLEYNSNNNEFLSVEELKEMIGELA